MCGIDISANCVAKAKERLQCEVFVGSILDTPFIEEIWRKYDSAILGAVLHHLVGKTRRESKGLARLAVCNALRLLAPGGHLFILEHIFYPSFVMDAVFYVKRLATRLTSRRIPILGEWNNIGAPVVSYFTNEQLTAMLHGIGGCAIVGMEADEQNIPWVMRCALITRRTDTTVVLRHTAG